MFVLVLIVVAYVVRDYVLPNEKPPSADSSIQDEFIPSKTFQGAKSGWYFGLGDRGLGYHVDHRGRI